MRKRWRQQLTELHQLQEQAAQLRHEMSTARQAVEASIHLVQERLGLQTGDSSKRAPEVLGFHRNRKVN